MITSFINEDSNLEAAANLPDSKQACWKLQDNVSTCHLLKAQNKVCRPMLQLLLPLM